LAYAALIACLLSSATAAFAAGTGDDPTPSADVLGPSESIRKARLEQDSPSPDATSPMIPSGGITPLALDAPFRYLSTPSHKQETGYWCGPATCQVIDDFHGAYVSQATYAKAMGTARSGTDFSKLDDCLRKYTGKPYYYYGGLTESGFNGKVADSILNHTMPLAADVKIIASVWPNYNYNHDGHILPVEGFDWRYDRVRLNDVFNEADYYSAGGPTYGHITYARTVVWNGVYNHFRRAVVSAP
jgi:hypothetical protein